MLILNIVVGILLYFVIGGILSPIICLILNYYNQILTVWDFLEINYEDIKETISITWPIFLIFLTALSIFIFIIEILIKCYSLISKFLESKIITKLLILFIISCIFIFSIYKPFDIKIKFIKTTENSNFIPLTEKEKITHEIKILEEKKKELEKEL